MKLRTVLSRSMPARPRSDAGRRTLLLLPSLLILAGLTACGPTVTMPDVVGMRLDAAHRTLEKLEIQDFEDTDVVGERDAIWRDANWVVVEQSPKAGTKDVDTDTTIKLSVGKESDAKVLKILDANAPFAVEMAKKREQKERSKQAEDERQRTEKKRSAASLQRTKRAYAAKVDEALAGDFPQLVALYVENADRVHAAGGGNVVAARNAIAARDAFDAMLSLVNTGEFGPPSKLRKKKGFDDVERRLRESMAGFGVACDALIDAIDSRAPSAFARELDARDDAVTEWNRAMRTIYGAADRKPPLLPTR